MHKTGKYLIAGSAGSGKTSVIRELENRGFSAYDMDSYPGATKLQDKQGNFVPFPDGYIDWDLYEWNWQPPVVNRLLGSDEVVFLGGITSNSAKMYKLFDKIFALAVDDETLAERILSRTEKDYGKDPKTLKGELEYRQTLEDKLVNENSAIKINAIQPLKQVVDEILANI